MRKEGFSFSFNPDKCIMCKALCCKDSKPSYLRVSEEEVANIAQHLKIKPSQFKRDYLRIDNGSYDIKDIKINGLYCCVFLDTENHRCSIYEVRPKQCREFPFWEHYKRNYEQLASDCPGIIFSAPEIIKY